MPSCETTPHGSATRAAARTTMESRRFGRLTVTPERLVEFPAGLIGFEELREYLMVEETAWMPLRFLVACDDPELAFPVLPAPLCAPDYAPTFPAEAFGLIGALGGEPLEVLAVCTLAADTQTLHANLQGPILLNPATRRGCQVVLHDSPYSLRHLLGAV